MNATQRLRALGQSFRLDDITRGLLTSGALGRVNTTHVVLPR
jgi:hypothetical protein